MAAEREWDTEAFGQTPSYDDIVQAAQRLRGWAVETPLLESPVLNEVAGGRVFMKAESLQRTGSFKFRGAFNRISLIPKGSRPGGVVAYSSGNHAQGVAAAAQIVGIPAVIVMPKDAPKVKIERTRSYGAEIVLYDRIRESREEIGNDLARQRAATLVRPYDDPGIIAGQGTCAMEIAAQTRARDVRLDSLLVCCGGGGLTAGSVLAMDKLSADTEVLTVEPTGFDDTKRSLEAGQIQENRGNESSICDALLAPRPGQLTFAINKDRVSGGLSVTDEEVRAALDFAFHILKLVLEPGGAVCLAAVLSGKLDCRHRTVALTLSGGNIDPELLCAVLGDGALADS